MKTIADSIIFDDRRWFKAWLNTPSGISQSRTSEEAARKPGCAVKSRERDPDRLGLPKHHGKLVVFDEGADRVVVRGWGDEVSPRFVWEGTVREYLALWECD